MGHKAKGIMIMYKDLLFLEYQQNKLNQRKKKNEPEANDRLLSL